MAIPRLAEQVGVTPRVLRYWEEQGLISPSVEHGRLRYGPRDVAIARLVRRVMDETGYGVEGLRVLKALAEREIHDAAGDAPRLAELALRLLYARKALREVAGSDEERLGTPPGPPDRARPPHPPPPHGTRPEPPEGPPRGPGPKRRHD